MEENVYNNIKYPETIDQINEWSFKFRYEFSKQLECFLSSGIIIDYISAKLIKANKLAIISTKPAVELNIINSPLFVYDRSYSVAFSRSNNPLLWIDAFERDKFYELKYKKMDTFGFTSAISLYAANNDQVMSISFATQKTTKDINDYYLGNIKYLYKIASFVERISLSMFGEIFSINMDNNCFNSSNLKSNTRVFLAINNVEATS